ncbi:MAG TPA: ABC transporter permease [Verrucomicrobiae bacterium]|nr:ABC transporter permease [Verrucomicrobiae bacterium]
MNDLKFAFRQLVKNPGFTTAALVTLAVCLGTNLAIFAVVHSVLLRPLPFPQSDRLVTLFNTYPKAGVERMGASLTSYYERRGHLSAFTDIATSHPGTAIVGETGATAQEQIMRVSPEFFRVLGVDLARGRAFTDQEMTYQSDGVVILTDTYWRHEFNADPAVIGRHLRVDGVQKTIVGVLPPGFRFLSSTARLYFPLSSDPGDRAIKQRHSNTDFDMIGRLKPSVSLVAAQAEIDADNVARAAEYPDAKMINEAGFRTLVRSLKADHVQAVRPTLLLLQAGVLLLLLSGAVNIVNLLLVRASRRAREVAIRLSLGANRRHIIRHVLIETVLLTTLGGVGGLALAAAGIRFIAVFGARQLPLGGQIAFDGRLSMVGLIASVVLGFVIGGLIAWFNLLGQPATATQSESRGVTANHAAQRLRHGFIIAQVALAFVLLVGGGLLGLSLKRVMALDPGFTADHVLTGQIALPWKSYPDWPQRLAFIQRLQENLLSQPGVSAVGVINNIPFSGNNSKTAFAVKGHAPKPGESIHGHYFYGVDGDVFRALGIQLLEGRLLVSADSDRKVCVVDQDFARRYWPEGKAMEQRLFIGGKEGPDSEAFTVVGVVGAIKQAELTENQGQGAVYVPYQFRTDVDVFAVVRTTQRPEFFAATLQRVLRSIDPDLPVNNFRSMEVRIADSLMVRKSPALLAGVFAAVALLLAAIGTYGVLAFAVSQRRREIGVRMALGALPRQIGNHFLSIGLRLLAVGMAMGLAGAWMAGRAMQGILFDVPPMPLSIVALAILIMAIVSLLACWLPALRAASIDPMEALRDE